MLKPNDEIYTRLTQSKLCFHYRRVHTVENFVLRRRVNGDVSNVISNFIYNDIHVNNQMKILEVYRFIWKYICIVVLLLFYNLD